MNKEQLKGTKWFYRVESSELGTFEEWAEYLESLLSGPCLIWEKDGELILCEIKARVDTINGLRIEIYPKEHAPPHFHIRSTSVNASFSIDDCSLLQGEVSRDDYNKIRYWHKRAKPF